ncbi:hypothetical protein N657DRAFT_629340 [Parathielavia appendiculata]|uniref:Uncharacterized protein n=1 Tax=Parathielavia appendiculata TaxID=2587402 RepID=A0AAN6U956_9PEZI|nr:hypothetical protein N657DRAFT_629340 [Parathielavia appendiculata]
MTRPMLLALLSAAVPGWIVDAWPVISQGPDKSFGREAEPLVEPKQSRGPSWFSQSATTTTTTLTLSVPGSTSQSSLTPSVPLSRTTSGSTTPSPSPPPDVGSSHSLSSGDRQTSSETRLTDTMPTAIITSSGSQPTGTVPEPSSNDSESGTGSNRTLIITLSTVFSAVGLALIAGVVLLCYRKRRGRLPLLPRGVSPIDDDEIERWKSPRDEKARFQVGDTDMEAEAAFHKKTGRPSHAKHFSTSSVKKPPSVIVYSRSHESQAVRHSTDAESRRSFVQNHPAYSSKTSFDKTLPQTPIQARAPNARAGLTDESLPGDEPFIMSPKRTPSRLSKHPPNSSSGRRANHARARSSRSSTRSFGEYYYYSSDGGGGAVGGGGTTSAAGSELELSARHSSHDQPGIHSGSRQHSPRNYGGAPTGSGSSHSRVYSSSSIPPRLSFGDDGVLFGGLSPARSRFMGEGEIGRAIG